MKITAIEAIPIGVPYEHDAPKTVGGHGGVRELMDSVYLKVETDTGLVGWGEIFAFGSWKMAQAACEIVVKPLAIGRDASDIGALMLDLYRRTQGSSLKGPIRNALGGLDIALWDLKGKAQKQPIWRLLGGDGARSHIPAYASLLRTGEPEHVARLCVSAVARGYRQIKLHERNDRAIVSVAKARETVGEDIELMLDTNCAWLPEEVTDKARALLPYKLKWLEEPVYPPDDFDWLARLRDEIGIPISSGENLGTLPDFRRMIAANAVDYIQPDVSKFGGISDIMRAAAVAENAGVAMVPHSPMFGPGLIATIHIVAAMRQDSMGEYYYCDLAENPLGSWATPQDGRFRVPNGPGLGIEVDEDVLGRRRLA